MDMGRAKIGGARPRTSKGIRVLLEAEVGYEVGRLVFIPLHDVPCWAALAVAGMGKGGGCVFGAERAGAGRRAFVLDGQGRAGDGLALKLVVGIRILVVLCRVCHDARGLKAEWRQQQEEERPRAGTEVWVEVWVERDIESRPVMMPRPLSCKQAGSWRDKVCVIDGSSALDSRLAPGRLGHPV